MDRRSILSLKKRQTVTGYGAGAAAGQLIGKSITTPNSPRAIKQIKHSDKSNGSFGGAEIATMEEVRVDHVNIALLSEKLQAF